MKKNATRTRNIATDNIIKLAQSDLVAYAKRCELEGYANDYNNQQAYNSGNRQTVNTVNYEAVNSANGFVVLVPVNISWSYELDALNQADRIKLGNYKKQAAQIEQLVNAGIIDDEEKALSAVLDIEEYRNLLDRENMKDKQDAFFSTGEDSCELAKLVCEMLGKVVDA